MDRPVCTHGLLQQTTALWSQCRCYVRYCLLTIDRGVICWFWLTQLESLDQSREQSSETSLCPWAAARRRGVRPLVSVQVSSPGISLAILAPAFRRTSTQLAKPWLAARARAVRFELSVSVRRAPRSNSSCSTPAWPCRSSTFHKCFTLD